jgi:hypothetical protein
MRSKDILLQAKGGSSWSSPLRSDGFSRRSGGGGWFSRAVAQRRPRVSKLGLKELSNYYSNKMAVEAARQGAIGLNKRDNLMEYLLTKRELDNSSKPSRTSVKRQLPEKNNCLALC